jgi:hypothetical protein
MYGGSLRPIAGQVRQRFVMFQHRTPHQPQLLASPSAPD